MLNKIIISNIKKQQIVFYEFLTYRRISQCCFKRRVNRTNKTQPSPVGTDFKVTKKN